MDRKRVLLQCFITAAKCTNKFAGGTELQNYKMKNYKI